MSSLKFEYVDNSLTIVNAIELDPLNQVGLLIAKGFLNMNFKNFYNTFLEQLLEFVIDRKKNNYYDDLRWFNDKKDIKRIIEENFAKIKHANYKLPKKYLDQME